MKKDFDADKEFAVQSRLAQIIPVQIVLSGIKKTTKYKITISAE